MVQSVLWCTRVNQFRFVFSLLRAINIICARKKKGLKKNKNHHIYCKYNEVSTNLWLNLSEKENLVQLTLLKRELFAQTLVSIVVRCHDSSGKGTEIRQLK